MFLLEVVRSRLAPCNELLIGGDESAWKVWQDHYARPTQAWPCVESMRPETTLNFGHHEL